MRIGELAARTGCPVTRIRFYETKGILPTPRRGAGGQRIYGEDAVKRLQFISTCRANGMKLECIERFIEFEEDPTRGSAWLLERIDEYLEKAERLKEEINRAQAYLRHLRERFPEEVLEAAEAGESSKSL